MDDVTTLKHKQEAYKRYTELSRDELNLPNYEKDVGTPLALSNGNYTDSIIGKLTYGGPDWRTSL